MCVKLSGGRGGIWDTLQATPPPSLSNGDIDVNHHRSIREIQHLGVSIICYLFLWQLHLFFGVLWWEEVRKFCWMMRRGERKRLWLLLWWSKWWWLARQWRGRLRCGFLVLFLGCLGELLGFFMLFLSQILVLFSISFSLLFFIFLW